MFWSRRAIAVTGLLSLASFLPGPAAQAAEVQGFGNCGPLVIQRVLVTGCSALPCTFVKGNTYEVRVTFLPDLSSNDITLTTSAQLPVGGQITLSQAKGADIGLPTVTAGQSATFTRNFEVPALDPPHTGTERWNLTGGGEGTLACFDLPVNVRSNSLVGDL